MPGLCCWRREYQLDCVCIQEEVVAQLRENSENIMEEMERMKVSGVTATGSISIIYLRQQQLRYEKCGYQFCINMIHGVAHTLKEVQLTHEGWLLSNQFRYCYVISCVLMCDMRL